MRPLVIGLAVLLAAYLLVCLLVWLQQGRLIFFPERRLFATPAASGLAYEDVFLETADGHRVHAWFLPTEEARGTLLFCHGNAGNLSHRVEFLRFLHELGFSVLALEYRGYGRSGGEPSEAGLYADAAAAWRHLTGERGLAPERIAIHGRSLGAAVAIELASRVRPGALVIESAFTSAADLGRRVYPWLPVRPLLRHRFDSLSRVGEIGVPKLFVHAHEDEVVPFAMGRRLHNAAAEPKRFLAIHGGHDDGWLVSRADYVAGLDRFLSAAGFPAEPLPEPAGL